MPLQVRLFVLSVALVAIASCTFRESITNRNSAEPSSNRDDKASGAETKPSKPCLNLNVAAAEDLIRLPGIGEVIAKRIIDYRERHGRFRRAEEIIIIEGFSERKYRAIAWMVCIE